MILNEIGKLKVNPDWAKLPLFSRKGWKRYRFDQIAENIGESVMPTPADSELYVGLEHMDSGSLRIRRWGSESDLIGQKLRMCKGDILFARRNAYLRRVAIAPHDGLFSAHGMILRARRKVVLPEFLPFMMMSGAFMDRAEKISVGSLSPTINWTTLKLEEFDLPELDQQRNLAEVLGSVDTIISDYTESANSLEETRKAFLKDTVMKGHASISKGDRGKWPNWQLLTLADVVEFLDGQRKPIREADRATRRGKYPYYGASGVIDSIDDYLFDEPLILLGEDGANIVDRSSPLAFRVDGKIWVNNHAHVMRVKAPHSLIFLEHYLESLDYKPFVSGTAQPKLNKGACELIPVPVPDGKFQLEIENRLLEFEKASKYLAESVERARRLLTKILEEIIRG